MIPALPLIAAVAFAQDDAPVTDLSVEADVHFRHGVESYKAGDYREALEHLMLSNRLVPNRNVMRNIALTWEKLGDYQQAYRYYADYVALEPDPQRRAVGEAAITAILGKVALVRVESDPPGATVYVDRKNLGARASTPRTLALPPGEHVIIVEKEGHVPVETRVTAAIGGFDTADVTLEPILGKLHVDGTVGASIRVDDEQSAVIGTVPADLALPPGPHVLVVSAAGRETKRIVADVDATDASSTVAELDLLTGRLVVNALERDARIDVDGATAGFTPAVLDLAVGAHTVNVTLQGFRPWESSVEVKERGEVTLDVRLRSVQEVTAASRTTQAVEDAPASVSIISRQEIRAFGYETVADAVAASRGVYTTNDLTYESLGLRGFGRLGDYGNRVLSTWDGHTLNDDQVGASYVSTDLSADLSEVERIEIVRGPGSALYGSNAFFGVINVVTSEGEQAPKASLRMSAEGARMLRWRTGARVGDADRGGQLSVAGSVGQGADYWFPVFEDASAGSDGWVRGADGSASGQITAKAWAGDVTVQAYHNGRMKRIPTGAYETVPGDPRATSDDYRSFAEVRWEPKFGETARLYARAYADRYAFGGQFPYDDGTVVHDRWTGAWTGVEPRFVWTPSKAVTATVGAEARFNVVAKLTSADNIDGVYLDATPTQQAYSGYAVVEAHAKDVLAVSLGGRYDRFTLSDTGAFNPRLAFVLKPSENDVVKLLVGTAYRAPSPFELNYNDGGITQVQPASLSPESVRTAELEASHRFDDVTVLTASAYYNEISQLIDTTEDAAGLIVYANTDAKVRVAGGEYELRRDWQRGTMLAAQHSIAVAREGSLKDGDPLTNSPTHLIGVKAAAPVVSGVSTIATRLRAGSPRLTEHGDHTPWSLLWDVTMSGELQAVPVSYAVGVRNTLDWKVWHPGGVDLAMDAVPQPGRTLFVSLEGRL